MVVAGRIRRVAFYCRMNHSDRDYTQFFPEVELALNERFGKGNWQMQMFFEVASGMNPDRKEFNRLKLEIEKENLDTVVITTASKLSRDWKQFMDFMKLCQEKRIKVITTREPENAQLIYDRITQFQKDYFGEWEQL
ncbi:recombinase family protein [Lacrimispora brassicae]